VEVDDMREVPSWDKYFISIAQVAATRSKDPNTQVGSVLVDTATHKIISIGYNGMPAGWAEDPSIWQRPEKYGLVIHSEVNTILNANAKFTDATLYVTCFPCPECAKLIAARGGITRVVYASEYYTNTLSQDIFARSNIKVEKV
jgi:dCMP deaminase